MTATEIEEALAAAIRREYVARQAGAAEQQAEAMNEIRQLRTPTRKNNADTERA